MINVNIFYRNETGCTFDFDYYCKRHMPMVQEKMAGACSHFTVEKGLGGGVLQTAPTYVAIGHLFFGSIEDFQTAFGPHALDIAADVPNYTNLKIGRAHV